LYKSRDELDAIGVGLMAGTPLAAPVSASARRGWHAWIEAHFHKLDMAEDLAEEIGTRRWYRGFAAMLTLAAAALALWPDFSALEAATAVSADKGARDELRSQTIRPLASPAVRNQPRASAAVVPLGSVPERASVQLVASLGQGDSLARMLQRAGVGPYDASRAAEVVGAVMAKDPVVPGTRFAITLGRREAPGAPRSLEKLSFRARFDLDLTVARQGDVLGITRHAVAIDATPLRIRGTVGESLFRSARAAGAPMKAIEQYLQTVAAHLSLDGDIQPSDHFDMIVDYKRAAGGDNEVGQLAYAGLERAGKPIAQLVRWKDGRFVDAAEMARPQVMAGGISAGVIQPVNGRITSPFGARRHPILGYVRMHAGVDFGAAYGSPIFAVSDGVVSFAGRRGGHGNYVRLEHGGGIGTGYAHMSRIAVSPGSRVQAGQVIGTVGSTGLSTGPHLHYELYHKGRTVNPLSMSFGFKAATTLESADKGELAAVNGKIAALKKVTPGAALQKFSPIKAMPPKAYGKFD
jgi:murein DD-endopeptidase MepM/ murein hydrolase activator NlpD